MFEQLEVNSSKLAFYQTEGNDPLKPVIVLGHALGVDHRMWEPVIAYLQGDYRVICWDQPGHGNSELLDSGDEASIYDTIDELERGLEELGVESFHLGGLSLGGAASIAYAQRRPKRLLSLGIFDSTAGGGDPKPWIERAQAVAKEGLGLVVDSTLTNWFSADYRVGSGKEQVQIIRDIILNNNPLGYAQCCRIIASNDLWDAMGEIEVPTIIISGEFDAGSNASVVEELAASIDAPTTTHIIPKALHLSAVECPQEFAEVYRDFLQSI